MTTEPPFTADTMFTVLEVKDTWGDRQGHGTRYHNYLGQMAHGSLLPLDKKSSWSSAPCAPGANFHVGKAHAHV